MALDEFIFGKIARYRKLRSKKKLRNLANCVFLEERMGKLTLLARALTGENIKIYPAKEEGAYKGENFFLPEYVNFFDSTEENRQFYLFRTIYLSIQKTLGFNWKDEKDHELKESREAARNHSSEILDQMFKEFPVMADFYEKIQSHLENGDSGISIREKDIFGKWMTEDNEGDGTKKDVDNHLINPAKKEDITSTLEAKPVEELVTLEVDKKQQEDYVMNHNFEKVETAEEHEGGWRDFDGDDDMKDHENALEDLNMKYTVRVDDPVHSIYKAEFIENATVSESAENEQSGHFLLYDEWDHSKNRYKLDYCKVFPVTQRETNVSYYKETISKYNSVLISLRKMLVSMNNKYQQQRRQTQGEEFDLDSLVDLYADIHSRKTPTDKIYLSKRKREKDLSILLLLDMSLSSDAYAAGNRVIDVEKQISILFGEILNEHHVDFSIAGYYSKTRNHSSYLTIKGFDEDWDRAKFKIGAIEPQGYTRIGASIRHAGTCLEERDSKNKWMILISDGKPNDYDRYEGKYGITDVKQALRELNLLKINNYALAIEASARYYLPQMFGVNHYEILTTPVELLQSLTKLYDKIKYKS